MPNFNVWNNITFPLIPLRIIPSSPPVQCLVQLYFHSNRFQKFDTIPHHINVFNINEFPINLLVDPEIPIQNDTNTSQDEITWISDPSIFSHRQQRLSDISFKYILWGIQQTQKIIFG